MSLRTVTGAVVVLLVFAACDDGAGPTVTQAESSTTSQPTPTSESTTSSQPTTPPGPTTVTTALAPITTSAPTTTVVEPRFVVVAPGDGVYCNEQPLGSWVHGDVSSEAAVTVHGVHADVSYVGDTVFGDRMWRWHLLEDITLDEGSNDVVFEATFADGSTLGETRTYHYDPSLQRSTGYLSELTLAIPPRVTLELAALEYGELGLEQTREDTEITTDIPIADDAVFVVLGGPNIAMDQVLDLEGFAQLAATAAREEPLQDLWWGTIFPTTPASSWLKAAPWEFLLTPDGRLQQASQMYSP